MRARNIKRVLIFSVGAVALTGLTVLLLAANKKSEAGVCNGINVKVKAEAENLFVREEDVLHAITDAKNSLINEQVKDIDLSLLEKKLESNPWIEDAELYFDSKSYLNVLVKERTPVARVFTTAGNSFYVDAKSYQMPVPGKAIRLHVITGFTSSKNWSAKDSAIIKGAEQIVQFVAHDGFWNAQVGQIDIVQNGFEIIPVVGDHIIRIGTAENIDQKLHRAFVFYKQVMSKEGFNKYAAIDVQFDGQVVAIKKDAASKIDEAQLQKNIDELLERKKQELEDDQKDELRSKDIIPGKTEDSKPLQRNSVPVKTFPNPIKQVESKLIRQAKNDVKNVTKPKAVMRPVEEKSNEY